MELHRKAGREPLLDNGPVLDRLVELHVFGRKPLGDVPPYSADEAAAGEVVRILAAPHRRWHLVESPEGWTFVWFRRRSNRKTESPNGDEYVRIASATALTRAPAACLASLKLVGSPTQRRGGQRRRQADGA
jgi:hypothetical protein